MHAGSHYPERDRVMVLLSVRAGLRASEIAGLSWGAGLKVRNGRARCRGHDISSVRVSGKGGGRYAG